MGVKPRSRPLSAATDPELCEPTPAELAAVEAEWPLIEVGLALLDAEIAEVSAGSWGAELAWRRYRRLARRVLGGVRRVSRGGQVAA